MTHWTAETELYVEFSPLLVGSPSPFTLFLTRLENFAPIKSGRVTVVLAGGDAAHERFVAEAPQAPGVFRTQVQPGHASRRALSVVYESDQVAVTHDLGEVEVYADEAARRAAAAQAKRTGEISLTKEQQWRMDFATAVVGERRLRPSVPAYGLLRARPDGEVHITAPASGRLLTAGKAFPRLGIAVASGQVLATLAPQLGESADLASLELAVAQGRLDVDHAEQHRARLESLVADGAVPQRRVIEARHDEALARARLRAAELRLSHFQSLHRPAAARARGIDIRSPIAGTLAEVHVAPGAFVEVQSEMFHVVDLGRLWLEVQVPEANVAKLAATPGVWFEIDGLERPLEIASAPVATGGVVDPQTRTVPFLFELGNPEGRLRVGMSVRAHVLIGKPFSTVAIPASAIVEDGGQDVAFVQIGGETFERRILEVGFRDRDVVEIKRGLTTGERIVVRGAYAVKLAASSPHVPAEPHH